MSVFLENYEVDDFQETLEEFPSILWKDTRINCNNLFHITITNSSLSSIHFLTPLVSLQYLNLSFNHLVDLNPISGISSLRVLDVSHNKLCDLYPLQKMRNLRILRFHKNFIETLDPIRECTNLVELWMSQNHVEIFELFNLLLLKQLQHIFIESNPLDSKPKHLEFLFALSPNLSTINGLSIQTIFPTYNSRNYNPTEFFRGTDGRLMLTQARSRLSDSQREFLLKYQLFPTKLSNATTTTNFYDENTLNYPFQAGNTSSENNGLDRIMNSNDSQTTDKGKIKYFKAKKHNLPKKFITSDSNISEEGQVKSIVETCQPESAMTVVRFGGDSSDEVAEDDSNSPVAFVLEKDGTGYSRWGENGPIACSYDGKRLFSAYRNGGIAVIFDNNGDGSVLNPHGKCVLNIRIVDSNSIADILSEDDGHLLSRYLKSDSTSSSSSSPSPISPSVSTSPNKSGRERGGGDGGGGRTAAAGQIHQWNFQGLLISFYPDLWEIVVQVENKVVRCEFSNLSGGKLLSNDQLPQPRSQPHSLSQQPPPQESKISIEKSHQLSKSKHPSNQSNSYITTENHEDIRSGLQSIMSSLDDMLAGMKKKRS